MIFLLMDITYTLNDFSLKYLEKFFHGVRFCPRQKEDIFFFSFFFLEACECCCRYRGGCFLNCRSYVGAEFTKRQLACKIILPFCCPRFAFVVGTPLTRATDDVQLFKQTRSNLVMLRRIRLNEICTLEIMLPRSTTWKVYRCVILFEIILLFDFLFFFLIIVIN